MAASEYDLLSRSKFGKISTYSEYFNRHRVKVIENS